MSTLREMGPTMYVPRMDAFLNRWFVSYEAARQSLDADGGYLFPHEDQVFVTVAEAIRELGLDPLDSDWERIGRDWVRPRDIEAWERLVQKREVAV